MAAGGCVMIEQGTTITRGNGVNCIRRADPVESDESFVIRYAAPETSTGGAEMRKPEHRRAAERRGSAISERSTDAEWALVEPMIPPAKRGGRRAR